MRERYETGRITRQTPGFSSMQEFFMGRSPGAYGAMLGQHDELPLPAATFLDAIGTGLAPRDADALTFLYGSAIELTGSKEVLVRYGKEGWPIAIVRGGNFPNTKVSLEMAFLMNGERAWTGYVLSDRFLLPGSGYWLHEFTGGDRVKLDEHGFYEEMKDWPDIAAQIPKYPDLMGALAESGSREDDAFMQAVKGAVASLGENWGVYAGRPPSESHRQVFERYSANNFETELHCFVPTLDEIVDEMKGALPAVEGACIEAKSAIEARA